MVIWWRLKGVIYREERESNLSMSNAESCFNVVGESFPLDIAEVSVMSFDFYQGPEDWLVRGSETYSAIAQVFVFS